MSAPIEWTVQDRATRILARYFLWSSVAVFLMCALTRNTNLVPIGLICFGYGWWVSRSSTVTGRVDSKGVSKTIGRDEWTLPWHEVLLLTVVEARGVHALVVTGVQRPASRTPSDSLLWSGKVPRAARAIQVPDEVRLRLEAFARRLGLLD